MASPVYFGSVTAPMKAFMDRAGYIAYQNDSAFKRKAGGALTVAGRSGGNYTNTQLLLWFMILGMVVPGARLSKLSVCGVANPRALMPAKKSA